MKWLLRIFIGMLAVLLGLLLINYLLPREFYVMRQAQIDSEFIATSNYLQELTNWPEWAAWHALDDAEIIEFESNSFGPGARYQWRGEVLGNGGVTLLSVEKTDTQHQLTVRRDYFDSDTSLINMITVEPVNAEVTQVTFEYSGTVSDAPYRRLLATFYDDWVGSEFEKNLENLAAKARTGAIE